MDLLQPIWQRLLTCGYRALEMDNQVVMRCLCKIDTSPQRFHTKKKLNSSQFLYIVYTLR